MSRYEQPTYFLVSSHLGYEVRFYESHLAAETTVPGNFGSSGNIAFRRLVGYIFGRNSAGLRMNMTVPVTHQPGEANSHRYRFVLERAYSEEDLRAPLEEMVEVVRVPAGYYAAFGYRGGRSETRYRQSERALLDALERDGVDVTGPPALAVYNGPLTPPPFRHNEVLVPIAWAEEAAA